jgi:hypothetical protein
MFPLDEESQSKGLGHAESTRELDEAEKAVEDLTLSDRNIRAEKRDAVRAAAGNCGE